jgi:hypothetical protein
VAPRDGRFLPRRKQSSSSPRAALNLRESRGILITVTLLDFSPTRCDDMKPFKAPRMPG